MGFVNSNPDLSGTIFSQPDLEGARQVWQDVFNKIDPDWEAKPVGLLGQQWVSDDLHSTCCLIDLAQILSVVSRVLTKKSVPVFHTKIRSLLRTRDEKQFNELLAELQVAGLLSKYVSPIGFEPIVPEELLRAANKPKSPDYAIRLPSADVVIEVTVLNTGRDAQQVTSETLLRSFRNALKRKRDQFPHAEPYLLFMTLANSVIPLEAVTNLIIHRIWPNPLYDWINGIGLFRIVRDYSKSKPPTRKLFTQNPNARLATPEELLPMFKGQSTFHLHKRSPLPGTVEDGR